MKNMSAEALELACLFLSSKKKVDINSAGIQAAIEYLTCPESTQQDVAERFDITRQRVSHSVKQLREAYQDSQNLVLLFSKRKKVSDADKFHISLLMTDGSHNTGTIQACHDVLVKAEPAEVAAENHGISSKTVYGGLAAIERRFCKAEDVYQAILASTAAHDHPA